MSVTLNPIGGSTPDTISDAEFITAIGGQQPCIIEGRIIIINGKQYSLSSFGGFGGSSGMFPNQTTRLLATVDYLALNAGAAAPNFNVAISKPTGKIWLGLFVNVTTAFASVTRQLAFNTMGAPLLNTVDVFGYTGSESGTGNASVLAQKSIQNLNAMFGFETMGVNPKDFTAGVMEIYAIEATHPL